MSALTLPAADAPAEDWGRLAVSLSDWPCHSVAQRRGMVGWLYGESADVDWPVDGLRAMFIAEKGVTTLYQVIEPGGHPQHRMRNGSHKFIPDPDDPATAGCLLELLKPTPSEGYMAHVLPPSSALTKWRIHMNTAQTGPLSASRSPLGRACSAAAAALGRWPGGEE